MKSLRTLLAALLVALASIGSFTSCDSVIATGLEGTWRGEMYFASYYDGRWYYSNYSEIEFLLDPLKMKSGRGYWIDHYSQAPWDYVANHFHFTVKNRVIYIHFDEDNYDIEIDNYDLGDDLFSGYVYYEGEERYFELYHTSSPNWDNYDYGWDYDRNHGWGYGYYSHRREAPAADALGPAPAQRHAAPVQRPVRGIKPLDE